jgi:hypothetical protein
VGTSGEKCKLLTNHYRLENIPDITIYQYAIDLTIDGFPVEKKIFAKTSREILSSVEVQSLLGSAKETIIFDGVSLLYLTYSFYQEELWLGAERESPILRSRFNVGKAKLPFVSKMPPRSPLGLSNNILLRELRLLPLSLKQ